MRRAASIVTVFAVLLAAAPAIAPARSAPVPAPSAPSVVSLASTSTATPSGPCVNARLRCPDLVALRPKELEVVRSRSGRQRLRARNRLGNIGSGPLFLLGNREGADERTMAVRQRIFSISGAHREYLLPETYFDFWLIPNQGRFWKLRDALHFELWTADEPVSRLVKGGRKTRFCMRDLLLAGDGVLGPRRARFHSCSTTGDDERVRMGISVGWLESYPAGYFEQYVDVTGLRGCYSLRHIADPLSRLFESDESNNTSRRSVLLPARGGRVRDC